MTPGDAETDESDLYLSAAREIKAPSHQSGVMQKIKVRKHIHAKRNTSKKTAGVALMRHMTGHMTCVLGFLLLPPGVLLSRVHLEETSSPILKGFHQYQ